MEAKRDNNYVPTWLGTLNTDGQTPIRVEVIGHSLAIAFGITGTNLSGENDIRDKNRVTAIMGVSSDDGKTPTEIYTNSSGAVLIDG